MKQCPECGCQEFYARQTREYGIVVTIIPKVGPQYEHDINAVDTPTKREEPYGNFECTNCSIDFQNWQDIPDAEKG